MVRIRGGWKRVAEFLRLGFFVEERAGDVTGTVAEKESGVCEDFLRMAFRWRTFLFSIYLVMIIECSKALTGYIGCLQTQDQDKGGVVWTSEVIANQSANFMVHGQKP